MRQNEPSGLKGYLKSILGLVNMRAFFTYAGRRRLTWEETHEANWA